MAAATLVAQFVLALLLIAALARYAVGRPRLSALALAGGAAVLAPLCARILPAHPLSAAIVYVTAVFAWFAAGGALPRAEREALLGALRPRTQST
jgi:peptidoglycan/LPS O-acetylase OafA/YrhL